MVEQTTEIRNYRGGDAPEIARLFYGTVRSVNRADYSHEQVEAWAPGVPDPEELHARVVGQRTLVAEEGGQVGSRVGIGAPAVASPPPRLLLWVAGFLARCVLDHRILGIRFATQL